MHEVEVPDLKPVQLHGFSDTSTVAYAASVYLRVETSSRVVSHLIASKTRVSPLKSESVPRLELMVALILARLMKTVSDALSATLNINQTFCWSDSQIVIWWIFRENKTFKQYVQNRINEIHELAPKNYWRYCPSDQNPNDIASRGVKCTKIVENELWWLGPKFLRSSEATWPNVLSYDIAKKGMSNELNELKGTNKESVMALLVYTKSKPSLKLQELIQCKRYSSLQSLLRVTAYILRFIKNLKSKLNQDSIETKQMLSLDEIEKARELWINGFKVTFLKKRILRNRATCLDYFMTIKA
eukprot:gene5782-11066_t